MKILLVASLALLILMAVQANPSSNQETAETGGLLGGLDEKGGLIERLIKLLIRIAALAREAKGNDENIGAGESGTDVGPPGDEGDGVGDTGVGAGDTGVGAGDSDGASDSDGETGGSGVTASPDAGTSTSCLDCGPVLFPDDSVPATTGQDLDDVTSTACPDCGPVLFPSN